MVQIFVSSDGVGEGSKSNPCSLGEVTEQIRNAKEKTDDDIEVILFGGRYNLTETLVFTPKEGGSESQKVTVRGKKGDFPVLTSEKHVDNFSLHDEKKNIWVKSIESPTPDFNFEFLWSKEGEFLPRAWSGFTNKHIKKSGRGIKILKSFGVRADEFRNPGDIVMVGRHFWYYISEYAEATTKKEFLWDKITRKSLKNPPLAKGVIGFTGYHYSKWLTKETTVALDNAYEFLDTLGEWYYDRLEKKLYMIPLDEPGEVIYPNLRSFVRLQGTLEEPIENMEFRNIHFRFNDRDKVHATAIFPTEPTYLSTPELENVLQINAGNNISVTRCSFKNIGNEAISFDLGGRDNNIVGNALQNIAGAGIAIGQTNLFLPEKGWFNEIHPRNVGKIFNNFLISNNYLYKTAVNNIRHSHAIAYSEFINGLKLLHNEIDHTSGHAVRNSWRYGGYHGGHTAGIEYAWNKTSNVGMKGFSDYGSLYLACANDGQENTIHHNYVDGAGDPDRSNIALYLDAHCTNCHFINNVVVNIGPKHDLFGNYWVGFVCSHGNSAHHNWVHGNRSVQKMDLTRPFSSLNPWSRYGGKENKVYDNVFYDELPNEWPAEAQEIIEKAGLEPEFIDIKDYLQII